MGGDSSWAASNYLSAALDEAAVYSYALSASQVQAHYAGSPAAVNTAPQASFTSSCTVGACTFDASATTDPDGTVASYAWDFGDSSPKGTGASPKHTYAASGSYQVKLTVTDNGGATDTLTKTIAVSVPVPNAGPTASFSSSCDQLTCTLDASGSSDPDGSVASYAWDFGDGANDTGAKTSHTFASAGTYSIKLTVTDDQGAKDTATKSTTVTAPANQKPTAAFSFSSSGQKGSFDAGASTDADGSIASYAWTFGDGGTGTGATPTHDYGGTGSFAATLTVTDNSGDTDTVTKRVVVADSPLVSDSFSRTASGSWGTANTGGAWSVTPASRFATDGDRGKISIATAGASGTATLNAVSAADVNAVSDVTVDKMGTGGGSYVSYLARKTSSGNYYLKLRLLPDGVLHLAASRIVGTTETTIRDVAVSGVSYASGDVLRIRVKVSGNPTTALSAKVWKAGTAEPGSAQLSTTDSTAALQTAGAFGILGYLSSTSTSTPVVIGVDNVLVTGN